MQLQWKYALIINLSVLVILGTFYAIDDFAVSVTSGSGDGDILKEKKRRLV